MQCIFYLFTYLVEQHAQGRYIAQAALDSLSSQGYFAGTARYSRFNSGIFYLWMLWGHSSGFFTNLLYHQILITKSYHCSGWHILLCACTLACTYSAKFVCVCLWGLLYAQPITGFSPVHWVYTSSWQLYTHSHRALFIFSYFTP